ncbi:MAG: polyisoprenyl-teichoic acid--peptidoglycan teichoic acid transferase, partial [Patescibacteria group bacterium]|nr:polyisoprenyl-teichoic acid--peptidoglycan teichoic acid transferase [Patescibacteria group bacterium]
GHAGSTLADTMIVASVDPETKDVAMLSLPRDLYVPIPKNGKNKINAAHAFGEMQKTGEGPNIAKEVVGEVLDIPVHNYVRVDFTGFKKAVDVLGGVTIDVATPLSDSEYPCEKDERKACGFSVKAGTQLMNGATALKYARCRKGNCGNDFGRAARQQEVLMAMREKALQMSTLTNPAKLAGIIDTIGSHVRTDLSTEELTRLAEILKDVKSETVRSKVIDGEEEKLVQVANIAGASVVIPAGGEGKFGPIQDFAHSLFFDRHLVEENIPVTVVNASTKPLVFAALVERLKGYRYNIVGVEQAQSQTQSELIDGTAGKGKYTRRYLEARYAVAAKEDASRGEGIILVVGDDTVTKTGDR